MKKTIIITVALILAVLMPTSCSKALDLDPTSTIKADDVWGSSDAVERYIYGLYVYVKNRAEITNYNQANFSDAYSDILKSGSWNQYNHPYNTAMLQESSFTGPAGAGVFECWDYCYGYIRRCNEFLRDSKQYKSRYGQEAINRWDAEVRFIRAMVYFQLMVVYGYENEDEQCPKGGVPLRKAVDGPDQNDLARAGWSESWDFILADLDSAAKYLPKEAITGRARKATAYGMISRAALYAKRWKKVVDAADSCKSNGGVLAGTYQNLMDNGGESENLLAAYFTDNGTVSHRADVFFRPIGDNTYHNNVSIFGIMGPTKELVDEYEMADGTPFSWDTHGDAPFVNREPRFYASILYNGAKWEGRTLEIYPGGVDAWDTFACTNTTKATPTGYYFKKFISENTTAWEKYGSSHYGPLLRYAEVLLNKAEAYAELGEIGKACTALNEVRTRVALPGRDTDDKDEFMAFLRHERMVELAGEGFRFWDLRRWRLAEEVINGQMVHATRAYRNDDGSFRYEHVNADADVTRIFPERYYAFSIPETERNNNKAFGANNPGW